jgi:thiamine-phosphate pyrophosphorylase
MGLEGLIAARKAVNVPLVAIGGITIDNIEEVIRAGADGIAVISAVASAPDMVAAARTITGMINNARS